MTLSLPEQPEERRYKISEASELLDRSPHTLRSWDRKQSMPARLRPKRDAKGDRYWTDKLIADIKVWISENHFHPGRGIDYHPTDKQLSDHIARIRRSTQSRRTPLSRNSEEAEFREAVTEAIDVLNVSHDRIVSTLPVVVADYPGLTIDTAVKIVAEIFSAKR